MLRRHERADRGKRFRERADENIDFSDHILHCEHAPDRLGRCIRGNVRNRPAAWRYALGTAPAKLPTQACLAGQDDKDSRLAHHPFWASVCGQAKSARADIAPEHVGLGRTQKKTIWS